MAFIAQRAAVLKLPRATSLRLQLVAEELFTNTFRHGSGADGAPPVTVRVEPAGEDVELVYEDGEPAWNPLLQPLPLPLEQRPVGGLGSLLVSAMAERSKYERVQERNRVRVWVRVEAVESP